MNALSDVRRWDCTSDCSMYDMHAVRRIMIYIYIRVCTVGRIFIIHIYTLSFKTLEKRRVSEIPEVLE